MGVLERTNVGSGGLLGGLGRNADRNRAQTPVYRQLAESVLPQGRSAAVAKTGIGRGDAAKTASSPG